ncbi:hypothetical protein [Actinomadura mexicana]|uniref:Secreted protein n=1 Tax=Actinomadura mexicana TaxID=134959 RepID=A0A238V0M0_9ACTN|nr:hypothetical protein [Actinomadura mexicana]SNR27816.1 hypothetical protein SAMN06265355_101722 [Actinomadura mexicana]
MKTASPARAAAAAVAVAGLLSLAAAMPGAAAQPGSAPRSAKAPVSQIEIVVGPQSGRGQLSQATCPASKRVLNGGFESTGFSQSGSGDPYDGVTANGPTLDGRGWVARLLTGTIRARAVCVPESQAPQARGGPESTPHGESAALCPGGTKAIAGGYVAKTWPKNNYGESLDDVFTNAPRGDGGGWSAKLFNGKVEARALCS